MDRRSFLLAAPAAFVFAPCFGRFPAAPAEAASPEWTLLGRKSVGAAAERLKLIVPSGTPALRSIRVSVAGQALWIYAVEAIQGRGLNQIEQVRLRILPNGTTPEILLAVTDSCPRSVALTVGQVPLDDAVCTIALWGLPAPGSGKNNSHSTMMTLPVIAPSTLLT